MQPHPPSYKRASVYTQKLLMSWSISLLLCCSIAQLSQPSAAQNTSTDDIALKEAGTADILVRLHGSLMVFAWGLLAPVGIMLPLFYKVVWPDGQWFYAHIGLMVGTLVFSLLGVVPIVVHADGTWLNTTTLNLPHQILGIAALAAVGINPFLAICRCHQSSKWRWLYNTVHGSIGLILGEGVAFAAMLLGLQIVRQLRGTDQDYVHYAIYSASSIIGFIIMIAALFNIYSINYQKRHPRTEDDLGVTSELPSTFALKARGEDEEEDEFEESSRDYPCRVCIGLFIMLVIVIGAGATIAMLALL